MNLILEQSQKITKLESRIKKNEFENVIIPRPKELCARRLLQSSTEGSDADILEFRDKSVADDAGTMLKETQGGGKGEI